MRTKVTRRDFLLRTAGAAAGAGLFTPLGGRASQALAQDTPFPKAVVAQGTNDDSPAALLQAALDPLGGIGRFVKPGQTVAIKPNCTWDYPPHTASSTDPDLLRALILMVQEAGAKRIIVLDHPTISSAAECLEVSGIGKMLDALPVEKVFPDRTLAANDTYTVINLPKGKAYTKISVLKAAVEADVRINMGVAKSHVVVPVTLCLKHMMGFLQNPPALHAQLEQGLTDINGESAIFASLHILEAIRVRLRGMAAGNDTDLTNPKLVKRFNQIVAGTDPVLIDSYACINYFGRQPREIRYIKMAGDQGLGEMDVKKATDEGRLQVLKLDSAAASATPTSSPSPTATEPAQPTATNEPDVPTPVPVTPSPTPLPPTSTPLPTPTPDLLPILNNPAGSAGAAAAGEAAVCAEGVASPNAFLSGALLPVAAVVTGAGVVVGRRLRRRDQAQAAGAETALPGEDAPPANDEAGGETNP